MQVVCGNMQNERAEEKDRLEFRYYEVEKDFPVLALLGDRWEIPYGTDPMHFHNYLEIGYCHYGTGKMFGNSMEEPYGEGTVTVIPKNYPHRTSGNGQEIQKWEYLFIDADQFLENLFRGDLRQIDRSRHRLEKCCMVLNEGTDTEIAVLVRLCLNEMRRRGEFYKESARGTLESLLLHIIRMNEEKGILPLEDISAGKNFEILRKALNYIDENYAEDISIETLVKICNLSESHFRRQFKEYMHSSPKEYINLIRVDHACRLLANTDEAVERIAVLTGFQTAGSLIRNFKKMVGMPPGEWRKKIEGNESHLANYKISILKGW